MIDSHCHPDDPQFASDAAAMLERARAAGVIGLVAIDGLAFARVHQDLAGLKVWATVGVHPHAAAEMDAAGWEALEAKVRAPEVIGIGEIGLDYHYDHSPRTVQMEVFERQLALASAQGLPVSVHCREAFADCFTAIARQNPPARGVFHCFSGGREEAERVLALGWYLSFSGMLTFPKLGILRAVAARAPADRILIETDAPYLAPVPHRGRRNEPAWVLQTARALGEARGLEVGAAAGLAAENFFRLFPRAAG